MRFNAVKTPKPSRLNVLSQRKAWSASEIASANTCNMQWYLQYVEHVKSLNMSYFAKGELLHKIIEEFWDKLLTKNSKREFYYDDPESFADYAKRKWSQMVMASKRSKKPNPIIWRYEGEQWAIGQQVQEIALRVFDRLVDEPIPVKKELGFDVTFKGIRHRGKIDSVRIQDGKVIIRDYKSGRPNIGDIKVNFDPQPTFYYVGISGLVNTDPEFAKSLGLEREVGTNNGTHHFLSDRVSFEYMMLEDPGLATHPTARTDEDYVMLTRMIERVKNDYKTGNIVPEFGNKCSTCAVRNTCLQRTSDGKKKYEEAGQNFFDYARPPYSTNNPDITWGKSELMAKPLPKEETALLEQNAEMKFGMKFHRKPKPNSP